MNLLRKSLNIILGIIVTLILAFIAITQLVDPKHIEQWVIGQVQKQTGYELTVEGAVTWTFYPRLGVKSEHIDVTAPHQQLPFIKMHDVVLGVDFMQLLRGKKNLTGDIRIKTLSCMNLSLNNVSVRLEWLNNILTLAPLSANLYDGWMKGVVHVSNLDKTPRYDSDIQFNRVQIKPLLKDLNGKDAKLNVDGIGQLHAIFETNGLTKAELMNRLQAKINYNVSKGVLEGVDLNYFVSSAVQLINNQSIQLPANAMQTQFESLNGNLTIERGGATTNDTLLVSSAFTVKAVGNINLNSQSLDFNLDVVPLNLNKIKWAIPILIQGDLYSPTIRLDIIKLNTLITDKQLDRLKEKAKEKLKDLPKGVNNFIEKMLGH